MREARSPRPRRDAPRRGAIGRAARPRAELARVALVLGGAHVVLLAAAPPSRAQPLLIPNQMTKSFTVELHSVADDVLLYPGDMQYLFQMQLRPLNSLPPRIEFTNAAQEATLRIRDLSLFEPPPRAEEPSRKDDEDEPEAQQQPSRPPVSQGWEIRLTPNSPTSFVLTCDGGKGVFDFTDMQVHEVYLVGDSTTSLRIGFSRPNPVRLERFKVTAPGGKLELDDFLNANPKAATLQVAGAECDLGSTGRPPAGQCEIFVEGEPRAIRVTLPKSLGVRIEGPAATVARFDRDDLERQGLALVSHDYESRPSRLHLFFSRPIPKLKVRWEE